MNRIDRKSVALLVSGIALLIAALFGSTQTAHAAVPNSAYSPVITWISNIPCEYEDSVNCAWNAQEQGNQQGHSFIIRKFPHTNLTCWMYDNPRYSKHDQCDGDLGPGAIAPREFRSLRAGLTRDHVEHLVSATGHTVRVRVVDGQVYQTVRYHSTWHRGTMVRLTYTWAHRAWTLASKGWCNLNDQGLSNATPATLWECEPTVWF